MKYLLDTHILLWWYQGDAASLGPYHELLVKTEKTSSTVGLSIISLWEVALLIKKQRCKVDMSVEKWLNEIQGHPLISVLPLSADIILDSIHFDADFPKDPADRFIAATARCHNLKLMTVDQRICRSGCVAVA